MALTNWKNGALAVASAAALVSSAGVANAADEGACPTGGNVVLVTGSTASAPFWKSLAPKLTGSSDPKIVYYGQGSCSGVQSTILPATNTAPITGKAIDYGTDPTGATTCDLPKSYTPDTAVSDVYGTTCSDVLTTAGAMASDIAKFADIGGPIQAMVFAIPNASTGVTAITAQQAFDTFVYAGTNTTCDITPWNVTDQIFLRGNTSGTRRMLSSAIGAAFTGGPAAGAFDDTDGTKASGATAPIRVESGAGPLLAALAGSTMPNAAIGILSTVDTDTPVGMPAVAPRNNTVKILAYQAPGQLKAYLPDATAGSYDRINVRSGQYPIWGPLHFITASSDGKTATNANVAKLLGILAGTTAITGGKADGSDFIDYSAAAHLVPQCAMNVSRSAEVSPTANYTPVHPTKACGCYYEKSANGATVSSYCQTCTKDADCTKPGLSHCNYGYCEAS